MVKVICIDIIYYYSNVFTIGKTYERYFDNNLISYFIKGDDNKYHKIYSTEMYMFKNLAEHINNLIKEILE